ncbi:MAG: phosphoribosyltransferase family protein [bacterium]|nr:phosphoribosyltransferase family protein [bacterium]
MNEQEVLRILGKIGAVIVGSHVVYTTGKHGTTYINKDAVYPHTAETSRLCRAIAEQFVSNGVEAVLAPAVGGCILSNRAAEHLTTLTGREVLGVYADKQNDGFVIKRGYDKLISGKNILVVEDVLTTGGSARKVIEAARAIGCNVIGLGALWNRGGITPHDVSDVPRIFALVNAKFDTWDEASCPLCAEGVPINTGVGKDLDALVRKLA